MITYLFSRQPDWGCHPPTPWGWRSRRWPGSSCLKLCGRGSPSYCCPSPPSGAAWSGPGGTRWWGEGRGVAGGYLYCCWGRCVSASWGSCRTDLKYAIHVHVTNLYTPEIYHTCNWHVPIQSNTYILYYMYWHTITERWSKCYSYTWSKVLNIWNWYKQNLPKHALYLASYLCISIPIFILY